MIEATGVDREKLPELVAPDAIVGELLPEHAKAWGLPSGVRVLSAVNDTQALTFGTGEPRRESPRRLDRDDARADDARREHARGPPRTSC